MARKNSFFKTVGQIAFGYALGWANTNLSNMQKQNAYNDGFRDCMEINAHRAFTSEDLEKLLYKERVKQKTRDYIDANLDAIEKQIWEQKLAREKMAIEVKKEENPNYRYMNFDERP